MVIQTQVRNNSSFGFNRVGAYKDTVQGGWYAEINTISAGSGMYTRVREMTFSTLNIVQKHK
jgi:hypothetical protein